MSSKKKKLVKVRVQIGRPKRKSGVYLTHFRWGVRYASHQMSQGAPIILAEFQRYQLEEGPTIFNGLNFKLIEVKK